MKELEYPFVSEDILKYSKRLKRRLLDDGTTRLEKKIAVLGGSTTHDIVRILELFLLQNGIAPIFYESEYNMYWQDAMFENPDLKKFSPDVIFIHTTNRNIARYPQVFDREEDISALLTETYEHYQIMWDKLFEDYHCPIIQNNFELPSYRLLGNQEGVYLSGKISFLNRLNELFYSYARAHENFYIHDIHYLSSCYGLDQWADANYWYLYKYALSLQAIPVFAHNLSNIIKSLFGKNKKGLVLDLDNTLWGGIVGDDGPENLEIGQETALGQLYSEFQAYLKSQKDIGVLLNVCSKNEEENALAGLRHPDGILKPEDFIILKANWEPKSQNVAEIAKELDLTKDYLVFVDDNPAERAIVREQLPGVAVPELSEPEQYIRTLDRSGFFEVTTLSSDDRERNAMYQANMERKKQETSFSDYSEYLKSLKMKAQIKPFEPVYMSRIAQLTNKSNQFNLTTKRYTQAALEELTKDPNTLTLYGKLEDRFGDNGVVSIVIGHQEENTLHIDLWLMSCRVLKRDMEFAMMDTLVKKCQSIGIKRIVGYYYPTAKNKMVKDFYGLMGMEQESCETSGNSVWILQDIGSYEPKNHVISVNP